VRVRAFRPEDFAACEATLANLPEWFGLAESNRANIDGLAELPAAVAEEEDRVVGFEPLFESSTLWGPEDAALILVRAVAAAPPRNGGPA
jgi:hypothetical protein